jgi:hypothetical protein
MSADAGVALVYGTSPIRLRPRATRDEMDQRRASLISIVYEQKPATVRQVFYAATVRNLVEKAEKGYRKVQNDLTFLRRALLMPYGWLADNTRWMRKPTTFNSIEDALQDTATLYRKALWRDADAYVEIWLEKDALAGVLYPVTSMFDVPLMVARGYSSLSFLHSAAEVISEQRRPCFIYHLGDYDPSGVNAGESIERTLRELAPEADIRFERLAVTPEQIEGWRLPTRPTKKSDSRAAKFGSDISVELDAIPAPMLRSLVQDAIQRHLPASQLEVLQAAEASERAILGDLLKTARDGLP